MKILDNTTKKIFGWTNISNYIFCGMETAQEDYITETSGRFSTVARKAGSVRTVIMYQWLCLDI